MSTMLISKEDGFPERGKEIRQSPWNAALGKREKSTTSDRKNLNHPGQEETLVGVKITSSGNSSLKSTCHLSPYP